MIFRISFTFFFFLSACIAQAAEPFRVVGYVAAWTLDPEAIDYAKLTHINYSFVLPTANGDLQSVPDPIQLETVVEKAHANGVKVSVAIGGWDLGEGGGNDNAFETLVLKKKTRDRFVKSVMTLVNQYQLDGIDIDWEYPDAGMSAMKLDTLMQELSVALHAKGKILTIAVAALGSNADGVSEGVFKSADWINIMAYDGPTPHSSMEYARQSIAYWTKRGLPKDKLVLGVPFYGRDPFMGYGEIVSRDPDAPNKDEVDGIHYNGFKTIEAKTDLAMQSGGGIMIWDLTTDAQDKSTSLLTIIYQTVNKAGR